MAKECIESYLREHSECEEYDLISKIVDLDVFKWSDDAMLAIFQKHFVVRHCLWSIQDQFEKNALCTKTFLQITPTKIQMLSSTQSESREISDIGVAELKRYYLDWRNMELATSENVAELIAQFWTRYEAYENKDEDLKVLGLEPGASWETVQNRYRSLVSSSHPDKGGDEKTFIQIRQAYENIQKTQK